MTRRIIGTFLTLITALLALAVVPLGISMAADEHESFRFNTEDSARLVSAAAEERLGDHDSSSLMMKALASTAAHGDCAAVFTAASTLLDATACRAGAGAAGHALATRMRAGTTDLTGQQGQWFLVAVPVGDSSPKVGTVVFARSTAPLNDRIAAIWGWLTLTGCAGLGVGAALAVWLARWVSRPLSELGYAAGRIGDGTLAARAPANSGPAEVRQLAETFNRMAARTETLVHSHRTWVADVSHQLRTPLTALRLRLDLLGADVGEAGAAELAGARDEIARFSRLVDGLLAVARAESAVPSPELISVDATVSERVTAWEPVARERGISLTAAPGSAVSALLGAGDLEQMLDNIVANALEAVPDGGTVWVEVTAHNGRATVQVADNGRGMSEAAKESAFRRFANPGPRGNGLGLAIVSRLAAANGGKVELHDTRGGGLTVQVELPTAAARGGTRSRSRSEHDHKSLPVLNEF